MSPTAIRIFLFTLLPLIAATIQILLDRTTSTRERRIEVFLIYMFGLGVAGSGIGSFISHFFISDLIAESIGWPAGTPFQLEVGFANLAVGILGLVAVGRRDGFREATVIAATVFSVGATIVHLMDIAATGNLAPGNTVQNFGNLVKPEVLILLMVLIRREQRNPDSEAGTPDFDAWRGPRDLAVGLMTASAATGFGVGYAVDQLLLGTLLGVLVGAILVVLVISRAK